MPNTPLLPAWGTVPERVAALLPSAFAARLDHVKAADAIDCLSSSFATWQSESNTVTLYALTMPTKEAQAKYRGELGEHLCEFRLIDTPDLNQEIVIKQAGLPYVAPTFDFAQKALGGPNPMTNAIVSGLAAGGLGYGAGTMIENLFPERYLQRGKLRKNLAMLGGMGGVAFGAHNAAVNGHRMGKGFWGGWLVPNDAIEQGMPTRDKRSSDLFAENPQVPGGSGLFAPSVPIQQFNNAVWNDARKGMQFGYSDHTPPAYAAATSGLMTGLGTGLQSPIIRPIDVIHGIASAGVGLPTANLAGRALSAMAGLTPEGQNKLQDMGLWGGMMHALVPSILGMR